MSPAAHLGSSMRIIGRFLIAFMLFVTGLSSAQAHVGMAAFSRVSVVGNVVSVTITLPTEHVSANMDLPEALARLALASTFVRRGEATCPWQAESRRESDVLRLGMTFVCEAQGQINLQLFAVSSLAGIGLQYVEVHADGRREGFLRTSTANVSFEVERLGDPIMVVSYFVLGAEHVLLGLDHLAFLVALWLSARTFRDSLILATTFAVGHSVTLALGALGLVHVSADIVEPIVALSIAAAALEGVLRGSYLAKLAIAGGFGLVHGLGFATGLREAGLPEGDEVSAVVAFTVGIEAAQAGLLLIAAPLLHRVATSESLMRAVGGALGTLGIGWFVLRLVG